MLWNDVVEVSRAQAKQSKLLMLEDVGFTATSWQPFSQAALLVEMTAETDVATSKIAVFMKNAFMADTATGDTHTRTAKSFYNIDREDALEAQHLVTLTCATGEGPHTINLGDLVISHKTTGRTLRLVAGNSVVYPFNLTAGNSFTPLFEAEVADSEQNYANAFTPEAATLELVTTLAGVTITAHELERAGVDEESEVRLREREQLQWPDLNEGDAIEDRVKALALKASASIIHVEVDDTNPRGPGTFDVYIGGLDETSSDTDRALAQIAIENRFMGKTATPPTVLVKQSPEADVDLAGTVYFSGSFDATFVQETVEAALTDFRRTVPLGGFDFTPGPRDIIAKNDLETVIRNAAMLATNGNKVTIVLTTPVADLPVPMFGLAVQGNWSGLSYQAMSS